MPLYEYVCRSCRAPFEKLVPRFGDEVACPSCASREVERQLSVFAVGSSRTSFRGCGAGACEAGPCGAIGSGGGPGPCGGGACGLPS
jgi:putative FmdB family regulatory protein